MHLDHLIGRISDLTPEEEQWLRETVKNGKDWHSYYTGEYTVIRKDKLALLRKESRIHRKQLRENRDKDPTPSYCPTCGTKTRVMPCDEELTYCPQCDLDHIY